MHGYVAEAAAGFERLLPAITFPGNTFLEYLLENEEGKVCEHIRCSPGRTSSLEALTSVLPGIDGLGHVSSKCQVPPCLSLCSSQSDPSFLPSLAA